MKPRHDKLTRVRRLIRAERRRQPTMHVPFLSALNGRRADRRSANKFMLECILDYQMDVDVVWENVRRFAVDDLGDPHDLFEQIVAIRRWNTEAVRRRYRLHRFPAAHARVRRIALEIVERFGGDARKIWKGCTPCVAQKRLESMRVGPQLSRMTVGALRDTKQIVGTGELKADVHVRRVLGRVFTGDIVSASAALQIAREMKPRGSWTLDAQLFRLGKSTCTKTHPNCGCCFLRSECEFRAGSRRRPRILHRKSMPFASATLGRHDGSCLS